MVAHDCPCLPGMYENSQDCVIIGGDNIPMVSILGYVSSCPDSCVPKFAKFASYSFFSHVPEWKIPMDLPMVSTKMGHTVTYYMDM